MSTKEKLPGQDSASMIDRIQAILRNRYGIVLSGIALLIVANICLRIALPGTDADVRPQVVIIFLIGYLYGPVIGFLAGFAGNVATDLLLGYGFKYLLSWSVGNGLIGLVMGLFPRRKQLQLENLRQLFRLMLYIVAANIISFGYSGVVAGLIDQTLNWDINFRYYLLPPLNSNILISLFCLPGILFLLKRVKPSYAIKSALALFYLIALILIISWLVIFPAGEQIGSVADSPAARIPLQVTVEAFNRWALTGIALLLFTLFASGWISGAILRPVSTLEGAVNDLLRGDDESAGATLQRMSTREDELALLSFTMSLLSKRIWEDQRLFREEFVKRMKFISGEDNISDVFFIGLASLFGKELMSPEYDLPGVSDNGAIRAIDAISLAVTMGGFTELAATYSETNICKSLGDDKALQTVFSRTQLQCLALAVDLNLLFAGKLRIVDFRQPLDESLAWHLLYRIHRYLSSEKNFIGYVTEEDITARLTAVLEKEEAISAAELEKVMDRAVIEGLISGYNIKRVAALANFDRTLTLSYGHSNVKHLMQLTGLLKRERVQAKLQLEPKRSVFIYLDSWIKIEKLRKERLGEGYSLVRCDEFDLVMEFTQAEKRAEFQKIISTWGSLEEDPTDPVLYKSWVAPLFFSDVPTPGYYRANALFVLRGDYQVQTYIPEEKVAAIRGWFHEHFPAAEISIRSLWVNEAFYRYIRNPNPT